MNEWWKASLLWDLGIPKPKGLEDKDMPETSVTFLPESHRTETDFIWKATGFANSDEYAVLMSNPGNDYRKRSLPDQESPLITLTTAGMGDSWQLELGKSRITLSPEISLLIFMWIAAVVICGAIVWVVAKIESKIHRFVESDISEFGEKC
ncbi:hypothetical protein HOY80DRAFT_1000822 [Tuber brumale]|nr:hypothetical protein HOY80DRAFT_1000822 [Tuber brumale]